MLLLVVTGAEHHQVVALEAVVVDNELPVVHLPGMGGLGVADPDEETVVLVGRLVPLPVGPLHQMVGGVVDISPVGLLTHLGHTIPTLVIAEGHAVVLVRPAHQLVQDIVLVVDDGILALLLHQVAQGVVGVGGGLLGHGALDDPTVLVVFVAMLALLGLLIGLVLGTGVFRLPGLAGLVGILRLIRLFAAVQSGGIMPGGILDAALVVLGLPRRYLAVSVAVAGDGSVVLAGVLPTVAGSGAAVVTVVGDLRDTRQAEHTVSGAVGLGKDREQVLLVGERRRQQSVHHLTGAAFTGGVGEVGGGLGGLAMVVLHLGQTVALGIPGVGGLEVLLAAQVVLVQFVAGVDAAPVGNAHDAAILIIVECPLAVKGDDLLKWII